MAKLVDIYNSEKEPVIKRRQLPLTIYENLTMIMDLNTMGLICDNQQVKGREYEEFMRKYRILTTDELKAALRVDASDIFNVLNQSIPCVGCRRSVERLFYQLCKSGHPTLDPLVLSPDEIMTIREDKIIHPQSLATLLNGHSTGIECLIVSQPRWKKSQRCTLHSLEAGGARGWSAGGAGPGWCGWAAACGWGGRAAWRSAWDAMRSAARDHVTLVHFNTLHDTLHNYLRKHRFCADCKTKVLRAYQLLVEEKEPQKEKGYVGALYGGIKRCLLDKHLHLQAKTDYIAHLIARAEPELLGNHRERHAKTLEIAQEEVLICLGICIYERLQRISLRLREEEGTCQTLAAVAVEALYRKFETAVEQKSGVSKLQLLYDEITQEELTRQQRKEQKKLKRRKKKERQAVENKCKEADSEEPEEKCQCEECLLEERDTPTDLLSPRDYNQCYEAGGEGCTSCQDDSTKRRSPKKSGKKRAKNGNLSPNEHSHDCGYSSGNNGGCCETMSGSSSLMSSPEGSEVACSEGFCNHERGDCLDLAKNDKISCTGFPLSLQEMLMDTCSSDDEQDTSYIPIEEVMEFKSRRNITEKRQELRQNLRQKFERLCVSSPPTLPLKDKQPA
ncbi:gametogenetin-binding protein 2-like [Pectinophora gossypiella]|uniref:gametogenetin-binding protein 2-like n=1 Tax=Pectinophora gossypiella TaxID=13191 RepID=UPI00214E2085|nr:gametogenetin-binding protein 2-like [Pectinophora gossypiella]